MKTYSSLLLAALLSSTMGLAQTDPGVTPGRITPTTPAAPAASNVEQTAPKETVDAAPAGAKPVELKKGKVFADAKLEPKSGSKAEGTVSFTKEKDGIKVVAKVTGVAPGKHGFHIHEKGDCSAADGSSAGGHFNPGSAPHAAPKASVRHVGDLGNIDIKKDGTGTLKITVKNPKDFSAWAEIGGKAVILHEKADDLKTQPTGDAGARIACGLIALTPATSH